MGANDHQLIKAFGPPHNTYFEGKVLEYATQRTVHRSNRVYTKRLRPKNAGLSFDKVCKIQFTINDMGIVTEGRSLGNDCKALPPI